MQKTIDVVDEFYRNPMVIREIALRNSEWIQSSEDKNSIYGARTTTFTADKQTRERIFGILGRTLVDVPETAVRGFFMFIGDGPNDRLVPHVHDADWAAIVYLSLPDQCLGGTSFYRHADTGVFDLGADTYSTFPSTAWEETVYIPMRFNRIVLFRASALFHRATSGFGQTPESGRLTQIFLFNEVS